MLEWFNEEIRCQCGWETVIEIWNRVVKGVAVVVGKLRIIVCRNCFKGIVAVESANGGIVTGEWKP